MGGSMKQSKLLNKTLRYQLGYAFLVIVVALPAFYISVWLYAIHEIDEHLKEEFLMVEKSLPTLKKSEISLWNHYKDRKRILPDTREIEENIFTYEYYDELSWNREFCRTLHAQIEIEGEHYILSIWLPLNEFQEFRNGFLYFLILLFVFLMAGFFIITRSNHKKLRRNGQNLGCFCVN